MDSRSILLSLLPVGLTLITYAIIRDLLWGIFLGSKSKKAATRIKGEQTGFQRFTQSYIGPLLTRYEKDFKTWMLLKRIVFSVIAQVVAFVLLIAVFKVKFWIVAIICGVIVLLNVILFTVMMNKTTTSDNKHNRKGSPWKFEQKQDK